MYVVPINQPMAFCFSAYAVLKKLEGPDSLSVPINEKLLLDDAEPDPLDDRIS